mmetsp:Transcript_32860/g.29732  ORF Transcript_32860/g.29732 Transcript_32860/m.29732 type:complete len:131 (-) Transcript_32860:497-889(-)
MKHCKDFNVPETTENNSFENHLLSTIRVSKNMRAIGKQLPKSNYETPELDDEESKLPRLKDRGPQSMTPNLHRPGNRSLNVSANKGRAEERSPYLPAYNHKKPPKNDDLDLLIKKELGDLPNLNGQNGLL